MPTTNLDIANAALIKLGAATITSLAGTSKEAVLANTRIEFCKRAVLRMHLWNFAIERVTLVGKTITNCVNNGAGLIRVTAATHGFSTGNSVTIEGVIGTQEANATWDAITVIDPNTFDLVGSTFTNAYSSGGTVALAPDFDYNYKLILPTDCLRVWNVNQGDPKWRVEGRYILCDDNILEVKYVKNHTDYDTMDPLFHECLAHYLAWDLCYALTQSGSLKDQLLKDFRDILPVSKFVNATEEPAEQIQADDWLDSRIDGVRGFARDPMT